MPILNQANLPFSIDAEQAVLGSILKDSSLIAEVTDKLTSQSFHAETHREIFSVMHELFIINQPPTVITVLDAAVRKGIFDSEADAKTYLVRLVDSADSPSSIKSYAQIIAEKYLVRQLMYASSEIYELAGAGTEEPGDLLNFAETKIYSLRSEKDTSGLIQIKDTVEGKFRELTEIAENPSIYKNKYISTSFEKLDRLIFGFSPGDLILVAGRPSMGKTTFAVNMAVGVAKNNPGKKIAVFSFEMSREQLVERLFASEARVTTDQMMKGITDPKDWKSIRKAVEFLSGLQFYIDDTPNLLVAQMTAKLRRMDGLGVVIVDYLQLMSTGRRDGNRVNEISEITRNLKIMAKELGVAVVLVSQLSRGVEGRQEKRPILSDLRDSGSIEQDADVVLMLYRDYYYNPQAEFPNRCECIVAKNRRGETGKFDLNFEGEFYRFTSAEFIHDPIN